MDRESVILSDTYRITSTLNAVDFLNVCRYRALESLIAEGEFFVLPKLLTQSLEESR